MSFLSSPKRPSGTRERARQAMRQQIVDDAVDLFLEHGYEHTSIEEVCSVVGVSKTSFFRYFASKEELLLQELDDLEPELMAALASRPAGEDLWRSMRRTLDPIVGRYVADAVRTRRRARVIMGAPSLVGIHREKGARWVLLLTPELTRRLGRTDGDLADPRPASLVTAAVSCLDAAVIAWAHSDDTAQLGDVLDEAMSVVSEGGAASL